MQHDDLGRDLQALVLEFTFRFSRFEFALKEADYLKSKKLGAKAEASWDAFVKRWEKDYKISVTGRALLEANPEVQKVGHEAVVFVKVGFAEDTSELKIVCELARRVRNNLFHGGKPLGWDDQDRMQTLLTLVIALLGELAEFSGIEGDYVGIY
jgi:hypothetical protein